MALGKRRGNLLQVTVTFSLAERARCLYV